MIFQALHELYDRLADDPDYQIAPPGYSIQKITFKVVLTPDGDLFDIQDARLQSNGRLRPRPVKVPGKAKPSGSGLNPRFLWDNSGYLLGFKPGDEKPERTLRAFQEFRKKHLKLEQEIDSAAFQAVCRFLEGWDPKKAADYSVLAETGFGLFQIQGNPSFVHQDPAIETWWEAHLAKEKPSHSGQCLITGEIGPLARLHDKIKGVAGAQSGGATIAGFNAKAYESYGKEQSYNAPVSEEAAFRYVTALNALLDGPMKEKHRLSIGDTTVVFWTERPTTTESIFAVFASKGSTALESEEAQDEGLREKLDSFMKALRLGRKAYADLEEDAQTKFFVLGLSPNAARLSVRFFHQGTLGELLDNLGRHYRDIRIRPQPATKKRKADPEFPSLWSLLRQTGREAKDIPPILGAPLLRAVVLGTQYPNGLYSAVLNRIRADGVINYARACVIKGHLNRNKKQEVNVSLEKGKRDAGYRLGRLFAVLEKTQREALGEKLNKTIRDSFYSSASATPGSVFPRILRTYQHHLSKLEGGRKINREKLVQEIFDPLSCFPAHLDLTQQGLFAIGYYHQTRDLYTKKESPQESAQT